MTTEKQKSSSKLAVAEAAPENFEHAFADLEKIVAQMESGQMSLEASLAAYQRGNALLQYCQKSLAEVEQQVQILNARNQLSPFQPNQE
ncbi:MAG TPA: exodeoxyribonuclease VII small subunit [Methylotenera sp.]|nr:exodeoxyribonuclease VII small subunit [Methylotenera sp.]